MPQSSLYFLNRGSMRLLSVHFHGMGYGIQKATIFCPSRTNEYVHLAVQEVLLMRLVRESLIDPSTPRLGPKL